MVNTQMYHDGRAGWEWCGDRDREVLRVPGEITPLADRVHLLGLIMELLSLRINPSTPLSVSLLILLLLDDHIVLDTAAYH